MFTVWPQFFNYYIRVTRKLSTTLEKSHSTACQNINRLNSEIAAGKEVLTNMKQEVIELSNFKNDIMDQLEEIKTKLKIYEVNLDILDHKQKEMDEKLSPMNVASTFRIRQMAI